MSGHTPGKLCISSTSPTTIKGADFLGETSVIVASVYGNNHVSSFPTEDEATHNARRLVACWNAADGLPTEELEAAADGRLLNVFEALVRDRDALLAGVREANLAVRDLIAKNPTMAGTQRGSTTLGNLAVELGALIQKVGTP